ncbi:hypothetical protein OG754_40345 (plasmid) [Streptomyces decoyicus]|uniref:hypothetical protein n=1 Tax=Streptomyces decoyicus TaxID=249567 RepID=UPI002E2FE092|nr:hypothetical protein [Streptomyces decoyicus]
MHTTRRPAASLATEVFDAETRALLDAANVALPEFGDIDLDIAFGTPLDMYEVGELPHEQLADLDITDAIEAIDARGARLLAARDIASADPGIACFVRERLVDVLLPYAAQLRIAPPATEPLPLAA